MRIMGLDVGDVKIGVAISDELGWTAQGITVVKRNEKIPVYQRLEKLIKDYHVREIVIGLPKNMNGTTGEQAEKVMLFAQELEETFNLPIAFWDERLSTVAATKVLIEGEVSLAKRKKVVDKMAAVLILQSYLDRMAN